MFPSNALDGFQLFLLPLNVGGGMEERAVSVLLTKEQFDRECGYRTALSIMGNLYARGLLTDKEYGQIELILARKFSPVWAGLSDVLSDKSA